MAVLYRKYRPQIFAEIQGQKHVVQTLLNQVKNDSIAHAYLFTGSRGVGKTSIARILAKAINCQFKDQKTGDACGNCDICKAIESNSFIDLIEVDAASNTSVENVRELIEHVRFSPALGKYKVFIIDEVHMLSKSAFNALLKTLEEPPVHAVFILATTEITKVPATIVSRTQKFEFRYLTNTEIFENLKKICKAEKFEISDRILEEVSASAQGGARDSLSLLEKVFSLGQNPSLEEVLVLLGVSDIKTSLKLFELIYEGQALVIPDFLTSLKSANQDEYIFCRDFLEFLRKVLVYKISEIFSFEQLDEKQSNDLKIQIKEISVSDIIFYIRIFLKAYKDLENSPNPEAAFLIAVVEATQKGKNYSEVKKPIQKAPQLEIKETTREDYNSEPEKNTSSEAVISVESTVLEKQVDQALEIDQEKFYSAWPEVVKKAKILHASLGNLLKNCNLGGFESSRLIIEVKFSFHKQNLELAKNQELLKRAFTEVLGFSVPVTVRLIKNQSSDASDLGVLDDAIKLFGGELVQ